MAILTYNQVISRIDTFGHKRIAVLDAIFNFHRDIFMFLIIIFMDSGESLKIPVIHFRIVIL